MTSQPSTSNPTKVSDLTDFSNMNNTVHICEECTSKYLIIKQEKEFYKKKDLPWPNKCPECRQKRRLALRNERKLYNRKCDKCQQDIISTYRPDSPYIVYCQECFWKHIG